MRTSALLLALAPLVAARHLNEEMLKKVEDLMNTVPPDRPFGSWENGTRAQAILEWTYPDRSVFSTGDPFPVEGLSTGEIPEIMQLAQDVMLQRPKPTPTTTAQSEPTGGVQHLEANGDEHHEGNGDEHHEGNGDNSDNGGARRRRKRQENGDDAPSPTQSHPAATPTETWLPLNIPATNNSHLPAGSPLLDDGAAGDPPSLGVAVILANIASNNAVVNNSGYGDAAESQLNFLLYHVPRLPNGAISHRLWSAQLWADNVYMVPPFLAYYGAVTNNQTLVQMAYDQIRLYREGLRNETENLWAHMAPIGPEGTDTGLWATGNAWAVAGMARVIATIKRSQFADSMGDQVTQLQVWANEIFTASKPYITENKLLRNYINNASEFEDSSATALMAAAGLRFATMNLTYDYVDMSLDMLSGVGLCVNDTGHLNKVTDPMRFTVEGDYSPEGQSFIILAYAAYNEWLAMGGPGNTHGDHPLGKDNGARAVGAGVGVAAFVAAVASLWVLA